MTKLLYTVALSAIIAFSGAAAFANTAKQIPSAQACVDAKTVPAKHALGCKLTKSEKKELKQMSKAKEEKAEKKAQ